MGPETSITSQTLNEEPSDLETQTVANVVGRGNAVEYCDECFPDLAE
jgi:hypothetical protein